MSRAGVPWIFESDSIRAVKAWAPRGALVVSAASVAYFLAAPLSVPGLLVLASGVAFGFLVTACARVLRPALTEAIDVEAWNRDFFRGDDPPPRKVVIIE